MVIPFWVLVGRIPWAPLPIAGVKRPEPSVGWSRFAGFTAQASEDGDGIPEIRLKNS